MAGCQKLGRKNFGKGYFEIELRMIQKKELSINKPNELKEFRMNKLNTQKFMNLFNEILSDRNGTGISKSKLDTLILEKKGDEVDLVNAQKEESLNRRLDERNILFLKKVEAAKQKILNGDYGLCEDCGSEISQKRLLARPTACLCIGCQEEKEKEQFSSIKHRRDLSAMKEDESTENLAMIKNDNFSSVRDIKFESVVDL